MTMTKENEKIDLILQGLKEKDDEIKQRIIDKTKNAIESLTQFINSANCYQNSYSFLSLVLNTHINALSNLNSLLDSYRFDNKILIYNITNLKEEINNNE